MTVSQRQRSSRSHSILANERRRFRIMLEESDRRGSQRLLRETISAGYTPAEILKEVVIPAIESISEDWSDQHELSLSQIYVVGLIVKDSVEMLSARLQPTQPSPGKVVIGVAVGDHHSLGKLIVAAFLRSAGFEVIDLGLSVPAEIFVDTALAEGAGTIAISALMSRSAARVREVRDEMARRGVKDIALMVGGAAFRREPELYETVGADAMAPTASEAAELVRRLQQARSGDN